MAIQILVTKNSKTILKIGTKATNSIKKMLFLEGVGGLGGATSGLSPPFPSPRADRNQKWHACPTHPQGGRDGEGDGEKWTGSLGPLSAPDWKSFSNWLNVI